MAGGANKFDANRTLPEDTAKSGKPRGALAKRERTRTSVATCCSR